MPKTPFTDREGTAVALVARGEGAGKANVASGRVNWIWRMIGWGAGPDFHSPVAFARAVGLRNPPSSAQKNSHYIKEVKVEG